MFHCDVSVTEVEDYADRVCNLELHQNLRQGETGLFFHCLCFIFSLCFGASGRLCFVIVVLPRYPLTVV